MDIGKVLATAQREVDAADIAEDLRPIAFRRVLDYLLEQPHRVETEVKQHKEGARTRGRGLSAIAQRLKVPLEAVQDMYYEEDGDLQLSVPSTKLARDRAGGTRQIALLVSAGRQAGFDEEWTSAGTIRRTCEYYGKFDQKNFAYTLARMDDVFLVKGKGQRREVRLKQPGWDKAAALIQELADSV